MTTMTSIRERVPVSPGGRTLSYLPMAHIAEVLDASLRSVPVSKLLPA